MKIKRLNPVIGAELLGINLAKPLSPVERDFIHQSLLDHKVIFFRDQNLPPEQHMELAKIFGELEPPHPIFPSVEGFDQITLLERYGAGNAQENIFHTDVTWRPEPALGSILYAVKVPEVGGDTIWVNMEAVYDALPDPMKEMLEQFDARHSIEAFGANSRENNAQDRELFAEILKNNPPQIHPVIRTHPETGRPCLFVNRPFVTKLLDINPVLGSGLLETLHQFSALPEFQIRLKWEDGTVAIWDNRCTMHYAVADYGQDYRRMHRITVRGDRPFNARREKTQQAAEKPPAEIY